MDEFSLGRLRSQVGGVVLVAGDENFDEECCGFNLAAPQHPQLVVIAESAADVQAAVVFAAEHGLTIRVQATGHGVGTAAADGVLVSTARMREVSVDPVRRTATVAAGARWSDVIEAASPHGLAALNGSSPGVGVVGYTLGGGLSPLGRAFGFAADRVLRLQLVTADGELIEVSEHREPELFWALRGGKCDVGVVTELEFELLELPQFYGGGIFFPGERASELLHAFRGWVPSLPEEACASIALLRLPDVPELPEPLRGRMVVHLRFIFVGDAGQGAELLAPMRRAATPIVEMVDTMPYSAISSVHQDPTEPLPAWDASALLTELPAEAVDALLAVVGPGVEVPLIMAELRHLGGALAREPRVPSAVGGGRDAAFSLVVIGPFPPPLQQAVPAAGFGVLDALAPWSTGGTNINLQGAQVEPDAIRGSWPVETVQRLLAVKRAWDPDDRFRFSYPLEAPAELDEVPA